MDLLTPSSARVKAARALQRRATRRERGLFLVEGWKTVREAASADRLVEVLATPNALESYVDAHGPLGVPVHLVDDRAMVAVSDAVTPQGLVGVCRLLDDAAVPVAARLLVICADVRDPGNAGTVIRTADAVGADAVVLAGDSVDVHNPKTVRASVGSIFHLPVLHTRDTSEAVAAARQRGLVVLAADGEGDEDLFGLGPVLQGPTAWLFGNEARGLPDELAALADHRVSIPLYGRAESLNLSTAAAVCLYASAREHRR